VGVSRKLKVPLARLILTAFRKPFETEICLIRTLGTQVPPPTQQNGKLWKMNMDMVSNYGEQVVQSTSAAIP
jgi:hypothetical protein